MRKLGNAFLNNSWIKEKVSKEMKTYIKLNENKNTTSIYVRCSQNSAKEIYSTKFLYEKRREVSD